jgi:flagellum-specific ATP synthase
VSEAETLFRLNRPPLPNSDTIASIRRAAVHQVTGRVAGVVGENIEIEGMSAPLGAICELLPRGSVGIRLQIVGFRHNRVIAAPLERLTSVAAGDQVRLVDGSLKLRVGPSLCGQVVDAFGMPISGEPLPSGLRCLDAQPASPASLDRPPIDTPLQTGVRAIDALLTCGKGQRLGIFAGSGVGKSTLLGMLARGSSADRIVIAMVGERGREVQEFVQRCLGEEGLRRSIVVVATSDSPAAQRVAAAHTATAIAESFRDQGEDVLLLFDSISRYATAQRELGLAAGEPPTTRGYPPSVFNHLPRLVERAGCTNSGSITAFYSVLVEGDDINEPIADALRGLLDGHIVLSRKLAGQAHWPPIDVLGSLSRSQPHLTDAATRQASAMVRDHLAEYSRVADLISIGAYRNGADPKTDAALEMHPRINAFLQQDALENFSIDQSHRLLLELVDSADGVDQCPSLDHPTA